MATGQLGTFLRRLRRVVGPVAGDGPTDARLLERFVTGRDEAAFELLVWRHGPMVLNVCRRVLRREHDAEDAFQATFLALVRKAAAIGERASVGGWLHKVAYRVALRARAAAPARPLPEAPPPDPSANDPLNDLLYAEMGAAVEEEIGLLPDKYRVAFVLCRLEGQTTKAAARALGCPPGTVGTRVARARALLRRRLARRGFDFTDRTGRPALPAALVNGTVKAALCGTAEKAAAAGVISARVAALTKGALRTMSVTKWALTAAAVLGLGLFGGGAVLLPRSSPAVGRAHARAARAAPNPPDGDKDAGVVLKWTFEKGRPFSVEATTDSDQTLVVMNNAVKQKQNQTFTFRWTPTGQDKDGNAVFTQKVEAVKLDLDMDGTKIQFDSTKGNNANGALADFYKALVGAEFEVTLDGRGKVRKVKGGFAGKLADPGADFLAGLCARLSDDAVRQAAELSFAGLPAGAVRPGDSWDRESTLSLAPLGEYESRYKYTYDGREGGLDIITVRQTLKFQPPAGDGPGLPFKIKKAEWKCAEGAGLVLFDREKGRVVRQELTLKLEGELTVVLGGQESQATVSQTQKTTVKVTDAPTTPAVKPPADEKEVERLREENERLKRRLQAIEEALRRKE